ncbi:MAG TPA: xanthine dehydrogenase family protein molybdopterin-binding subunit [Mycobacteriales bacterium]|nr:xanthine dehydrogenase family protein molybdopterin-binding subunit [Mycobacteriales bacterium]
MTGLLRTRAVGRALPRLDGPLKVTGQAPYAYEQPVDHPAYLHPVQAVIARGRVQSVDTGAAEALDGVVAVITHLNAPRLADDSDREYRVLQSDEVAHYGQIIGGVVADTPQIARQAAGMVGVCYDIRPHDVELRADRSDLYAPEALNAGYPTDTERGDVEAALFSAAVTIDHTYGTPMEHNNPMEPHTTVAVWDADSGRMTLYDSNQGAYPIRTTLAPVFGIEPDRLRVVSPYVGGAFGCKGYPKAHHVLVGLAAWMVPGRPVKLALTRQQMFDLVGYRTPTIQRVRLGADSDGRLVAIAHDVVEQTARLKEFAEQTATPTRTMYAAPHRRTTHRLAALDVAVPTWMRAPGVTPGMFAGEVAMDEMAIACGLDPIEFRLRNEPRVDPDTGLPYSSRNLAACLRSGARRFGWSERAPIPRARREDGWLVGIGVAASTYPGHVLPGSVAVIHFGADRCYRVRIAAADIGTGTWTALTQIAADALDCPTDDIRLEIGDTDLPVATVEGGSTGISCWGSAIVAAARAFRAEHGTEPAPGARARAEMPTNRDLDRFAMHAYGAQFAQVRVDADTGEIRVSRLLGVFAVGRIVNPLTARSQLVGGMTMGLSMALFERSVVDPRFGNVVNRDFAEYHVATNADVEDVEATWIDECDPHYNPMGAKGIGEIGIVGTAAAIVNAVHHATGIRVRQLPVTPDKLLP